MPLNILPKELIDEYKNMKNGNNEDAVSMNKEDFKFIINLVKRYPLSWYFIFKCLIKITIYSDKITNYNVTAMIVCSEYSFTSSLLTEYCEQRKVQHINVMHGEKLYYMRDSFFKFHRFYIWDEHYKALFLQLRASDKQFFISIPESIQFKQISDIQSKCDYTYYLANEKEKELVEISNYLKKLSSQGKKIAVRPHPRYSDIQSLR